MSQGALVPGDWVVMKFRVLPPDSFTWERYCGVLGIDPSEVWDFCTKKPRGEFRVLGVILSECLRCRPKPELRAVLLGNNAGIEVWFHDYFDPEKDYRDA